MTHRWIRLNNQTSQTRLVRFSNKTKLLYTLIGAFESRDPPTTKSLRRWSENGVRRPPNSQYDRSFRENCLSCTPPGSWQTDQETRKRRRLRTSSFFSSRQQHARRQETTLRPLPSNSQRDDTLPHLSVPLSFLTVAARRKTVSSESGWKAGRPYITFNFLSNRSIWVTNSVTPMGRPRGVDLKFIPRHA